MFLFIHTHIDFLLHLMEIKTYNYLFYHQLQTLKRIKIIKNYLKNY